MKTAVLVLDKTQKTGMGQTALHKIYKLSKPLSGYRHVLVSAAFTLDHGNETYIFGSNSKGNVLDWGELEGSYVGGLSHETALENAGYKVVVKTKAVKKAAKKTKKRK